MKVHVEDKIAEDIEILNLDTGKLLNRCQWANQETGEYCEISFVDGGGFSETIKKGNIVLIYKG